RPPRRRAARPRTPPAAPGRSLQAAQELVVAHSSPPLRLHLDRHEAAVLEACLPDGDAAAVELAARADVRRESPDPVQKLLRWARPVELAVGGGELLGVRRALGRLGR